MEVKALYGNRFADAERARKVRVWTALWRGELSRWVSPGDAVLVKGSRGVRLEAVVEAIAARYGERRA